MRFSRKLLINIAISANFSPLLASGIELENVEPNQQRGKSQISSIETLHAIMQKERTREKDPRPNVIVEPTPVDDLSLYVFDEVSYPSGKSAISSYKSNADLEDEAIRLAIEESLKSSSSANSPHNHEESDPLEFHISTNGESDHLELHATAKVESDVDESHDAELEEALKLSLMSNFPLPEDVDVNHKLNFQLDENGFPKQALGLRNANWGHAGQSTSKIQPSLLEEPVSSTLGEKALYTLDGTEQMFYVSPVLGGGDCGFFAYGHNTNRYIFVRDAIDAVLTGSKFPTETRQKSIEVIRRIFTADLIQVATLFPEADEYLTRLGSQQPLESLISSRSAAEPHTLANFIFSTYAVNLECLSVNALRGLALMNNHTLNILESNRKSSSDDETLSVLYSNNSSTPVTIHLYYDGIGHFNPAFLSDNKEMSQKADLKNHLSAQLKNALELKEIGAQEYGEYTEKMKNYYRALCS